MFSPPISPIDSPTLSVVVDVDMASVPPLDQTESAKQANATITSMDPPLDRMGREDWLSEGRGRKGLRIVIVTGEDFVLRQVAIDIGARKLPTQGGRCDPYTSQTSGTLGKGRA